MWPEIPQLEQTRRSFLLEEVDREFDKPVDEFLTNKEEASDVIVEWDGDGVEIEAHCSTSCATREKTFWIVGSGSKRSNYMHIWAKESLSPIRNVITCSVWKWSLRSFTPPHEHLPQEHDGQWDASSFQSVFSFAK